MRTVASEQIRAWRERYADELAAAASGRDHVMAWWIGLGDDAFLEHDGRNGWQLTEAGSAFADLFWDTTSDELVNEVMTAAGVAGESGCCCVGARKGAAAAAFYQALGAAQAVRMPGYLGDFLITTDQAAAALPELERLLAGARREGLVERVGRWLDHAANGSASEASEIVDGVLRVFREAVAQGLGVAAVSACF